MGSGSQSGLYIHHATPKIVYAGSWKTAKTRLSLLGTPYSLEVSLTPIISKHTWLTLNAGCGRFFEGTPAEMHTALNKTLAALPDDTKVYVSIDPLVPLLIRLLTRAAGS